MLNLNYTRATYATVQNIADLFKGDTSGGSIFKVKQIYDHLNMLNGIDKIFISIGEEDEFYQFNIFLKKSIVGTVYYLPNQRRIDIWGMDGMPFLQINGKKIVYKNYPPIYTVFGLDKCFERLGGFI